MQTSNLDSADDADLTDDEEVLSDIEPVQEADYSGFAHVTCFASIVLFDILLSRLDALLISSFSAKTIARTGLDESFVNPLYMTATVESRDSSSNFAEVSV